MSFKQQLHTSASLKSIVRSAAETLKATQNSKADQKIGNQITGDAIDSVIMTTALQGHSTVATDLVIVSFCLNIEPREYQ